MAWNYRVMRHHRGTESECLCIHEVFYDENRNVKSWTETPVAPIGDTLYALKFELRRQLDATDKEILDVKELEAIIAAAASGLKGEG